MAGYKDDHLRPMPKEIEMRQVGAVWTEQSAGNAVFAVVYRQERGMTMAQQVAATLGWPGVAGQRCAMVGLQDSASRRLAPGYRMP